MRWLLACLVLANLYAFALFQDWLAPWVGADREPQRLSGQRSPERLRVVPLQRLGPVQAPAPGTPEGGPGVSSAAGSAPAPMPAPAPTAPQPPSSAAGIVSAPLAPDAAVPSTEVCVAFGGLDEQRASRLREALQAGGARVTTTRVELPSGYLVYAPPAPTRAEAQQRLGALLAAGQADVFVVQDGPLRFAVSVGLFRSEETARALVTRLQERGETGLQIAPRGPVTVRVRLQAHWPDAAAAAVAASIGRRFDATLRDCN